MNDSFKIQNEPRGGIDRVVKDGESNKRVRIDIQMHPSRQGKIVLHRDQYFYIRENHCALAGQSTKAGMQDPMHPDPEACQEFVNVLG